MNRKEENTVNLRLLHLENGVRGLILENPGLPLLVCVGKNADHGEIKIGIGEFLDCDEDFCKQRCFTDREELEAELKNAIVEPADLKEKLIQQRIDEYESYWRECIILRIND